MGAEGAPLPFFYRNPQKPVAQVKASLSKNLPLTEVLTPRESSGTIFWYSILGYFVIGGTSLALFQFNQWLAIIVFIGTIALATWVITTIINTLYPQRRIIKNIQWSGTLLWSTLLFNGCGFSLHMAPANTDANIEAGTLSGNLEQAWHFIHRITLKSGEPDFWCSLFAVLSFIGTSWIVMEMSRQTPDRSPR